MGTPREFRSADGLFDQKLKGAGATSLTRRAVNVLQINLGDRCNQSCNHCHLEASPSGHREMSMAVAKRIVALAERAPNTKTVDLTGGAPELSVCFPLLVKEMTAIGKQVVDRCNLTVLLEPGMEGIPALLRQHKAAIIASMPCYTRENVDAQRGDGAFDASIAALEVLNALGYGRSAELPLTLVYNPGGGFLPGERKALEKNYRLRLTEDYGVQFTGLQTMTNMPIGRFEKRLRAAGCLSGYIEMLDINFNSDTLDHVMCRTLVSVGYDGTLYDCDFNLALGLPLLGKDDHPLSIFDIESLAEIEGWPIRTDHHCLGCTGGTGSGCFGSFA